MRKCYLVVHNAQNQHVVAVCVSYENAIILKEQLEQKIGKDLYKIIEKDLIW